jgi:8-oxo-dGTP pyrophosphatase MutT (NUDIX family)
MPDLHAAGAICFAQEDNKTYFLILRSAKHGGWGPPKGHADEHETEVETATRELYEETGVRRPDFAPGFRESIAYNVEKKGKLRSKEVVFFLCKIDPDVVRLSQEHTEIHLATLDEIEVLIPHEDVRAVFRKAADYIKAHAG